MGGNGEQGSGANDLLLGLSSARGQSAVNVTRPGVARNVALKKRHHRRAGTKERIQETQEGSVSTEKSIGERRSSRSTRRSFTFLLASLVRLIIKTYLRVICRFATHTMGMMGMFKWLRKDVQRDRTTWHLSPKQCGLNNESYRSALQAFIDRRRFDDTSADLSSQGSLEQRKIERHSKNNNAKRAEGTCHSWEASPVIAGVPHIRTSDIFEIGCVAGTEDRYIELIFAEWQNTRVSLKRHTHPECREAVRADIEILGEIRHPNILLLMATTQTEDHGLVSIFEAVDCTLYNYIHEQGERVCIQGIAKCGGRLADALRHTHMRGYVHGAISSHCVYLTSSGTIKLGGWELATRANNPNPEREYEERLRTEIFKWQAPEIFQGSEPHKESDVYGLALLIWEMGTRHVPWSGFSKPDVERQYLHWKRGVIMDSYNFPLLLNNLLEAGLQIDITKRTLDMNRMRRFLQRLEMQYEDEEPAYIDHNINNNNESPNTYAVPKSKRTLTPKYQSSEQSKAFCTSDEIIGPAKDMTFTHKQHVNIEKIAADQLANTKNEVHTQQINLFGNNQENKLNGVDPIYKNTNMLVSAQKKNDINPLNCKLEKSERLQNAEYISSNIIQPWNSTYRKVKLSERITESERGTSSITSNSSRTLDSSDAESIKDARKTLNRIKEAIANKREQFFCGNDTQQMAVSDISPKTKNRMLMEVKSKDYEPHKPASHKTSFEPKYSKSPSEYDSSYMTTCHECCRPFSCRSGQSDGSSVQPKMRDSNSASFFESSLWRKEKLICISKMRKTSEDDQHTFLISESSAETNPKRNFCSRQPQCLESDETYVVNNKYTDNKDAQNGKLTFMSEESTTSSRDIVIRQNEPLQDLKEALDRATEIVRSVTPNTDLPHRSQLFKAHDNLEFMAQDTQTCKSTFEDLYHLKNNTRNEQIKSIERLSSNSDTFLINNKQPYSTMHDNTETEKYNQTNFKYSFLESSHMKNLPCESITELSNESSVSHKNIVGISSSNKNSIIQNEHSTRNLAEPSSFKIGHTMFQNDRIMKTHDRVEMATKEKTTVETYFPFLLLNDPTRNKDCKSCTRKEVFPRRRSLPAALGHLRGINNSTLGKLPIRKGGAPDNTVEDIYIDDEFGDSLNVNMILMNEDLSLDDDFSPEISEL